MKKRSVHRPIIPKSVKNINYYEATAEFSLIISLTLSIRQKIDPDGMISRRLKKIRKQCEKDFKRFPNLKPEMVDTINAKIVSWSECCGWEDEVSVITFISFLLGLIEDSEYPYPNRIHAQVKALNDYLTKNVECEEEENNASFALQVWAAYDKVNF